MPAKKRKITRSQTIDAGAQAVEAYVAALPEPARSTLRNVRAVIRAALPGATEAISYGMPAFKHDGRWVIGYAAFKSHCSLFPGAIDFETFGDALARYKTSKGTIQFPLGKPLPATLICRLVKANVTKNKAGRRR